MKHALLSLLAGALLAITPFASYANGVALSARIVNQDVRYGIGSAEGTIGLREDAVVALAAGDMLATSRTGRVYLRLEDSLEVLLLPNSQLEFAASRETSPSQISLRFVLDGNAIVRFSDRNQDSIILEIEGIHSILRAGEGWFSIWGNLENSDVITVASGSVSLDAQGARETISASQGVRVSSSALQSVGMEPPLNGSRLIGILDGCDGRVDSLLPALNIRAGTTLGYAEIGFLENGAGLRIMGRTVDGNWYRIQRFSGFGWVLASAVSTDCVPPEFPSLYGENNRELFDVEGIELALLAPFYGSFENDPWFYRWMEPSA